MDAFGNVLQKGTSTGYGSQHGTDPQPYHLTTKEYDATTGLYYFAARWYDPTTGRFISRDPLRELIAYCFCRNNPMTHIDVSGETVSGQTSSFPGVPDCPENEEDLVCELDEKGNWCRDTTFSPYTHPGLACYRSLGGISGQQCCYDDTGVLREVSPDIITPASGLASDCYRCDFSWPRIIGHIFVDFIPGTAAEIQGAGYYPSACWGTPPPGVPPCWVGKDGKLHCPMSR